MSEHLHKSSISTFYSKTILSSKRKLLFTIGQMHNQENNTPSTNSQAQPQNGGLQEGKWWYSTFDKVTAVVGGGVLGLPIVLSRLGWVAGGKSLQKCRGSLSHAADFNRSYYVMIFAFIQLILSQHPNFSSLKIISLTAAVMSISYSVIATGASLWHGNLVYHQGVEMHYGFPSHKMVHIVLDIFSSLGVLAFAFAGHSVVLEIQATIPSTPERPSKKPMWRSVVAAYIVVAMCYFPVAISGFWGFGNTVQDDVWVISVANFMVFVHVLGNYQVFDMPVFDKIEYALVDKCGYTPGRRLRLYARSAYVVATGFLGVMIPFFGGLLGFFGGLAFATTSYILPCLMWLRIKQPKRWEVHYIACRVSIFLGILITILAPI